MNKKITLIFNFLKILLVVNFVLLTASGDRKMKSVAIIIAHDGFQPREYSVPKEIIQKAGFDVITVSNAPGVAQSADDITSTFVDKVIDEINPEQYAGIFVVGGSGALENLDTPHVYRLMKQAKELGKIWGAICISPRILGEAGLLDGRRITGWDGDNKLAGLCKKYGCTHVKEPVVIDDKLVTASGPAAAEKFGHEIVKLLKK